MKRSFLGKLQRTALASLVGALLLLVVVPVLQLAVLGPQGYETALATPHASLLWIAGHIQLFLLYRLALLLGFILLLGLPFALFRIIVAQEIVGRAEIKAEDKAEADREEYDEDEDEDDIEEYDEGDDEEEYEDEDESADDEELAENGMPAFAWRGKGFAVIAAWTGAIGLLLLVGGTLASTIYLWSSASSVSAQVPDNFAGVSSFCAVLTYTVGGGLLALALIFFGIVIARSGRKLWPDSWVAFGYIALAIGAIASGSAVQVALAPTGGQASLTTPTILLFSIWSLWF
ncbi:MAG: hypothetical protein ABI234_00750, partial [Ktedonobacteraceae bacterium]